MWKKIIKIPGKDSFDQMDLEEIALMIEADSAIRPEGTDLFDSCALDEFLHFSELNERQDLIAIRKRILENIYIDDPGRPNKVINVEFLKHFAAELREQSANAT